MSRSRNDGLLDILYEALEFIFRYVTPWASIPLAAVGFCVIAGLWNAKVKMPQLEALGWILGGTFATICLLAGWKGAQFRRQQRDFLRAELDLQWVRALSWRDFEKQLAEVYRQKGYLVEETGGGGPDGGVDLRLRKDGRTTIVQCKHWKTWKIGVKPVRELFGVMTHERADAAIFVTTGKYTEEAWRFAQGKPIELVNQSGFLYLIKQFQRELKTATGADESKPSPKMLSETVANPPSCPVCQSPMRLRTANKGRHAGSQFWGCSRFPACSGIRELS